MQDNIQELQFAFIKNGVVVNTIVAQYPPDIDFFNILKQEHSIDDIILSTDKTFIGGEYDGAKFWLPQPYPSWIKNEELNEWEPPTPYPTIEEGSDEQYIWDENTTSWLLLPPSN